MRITALAGGIGGARFLRGLLHHLNPPASGPRSFEGPGGPLEGPHEVTVIGNTADDVTLHGLRICPDLDTVMYTLGGGIHEGQGWGREGETFAVAQELAAYDAQPQWFTLGDRDIATHLVRTRMLGLGYTLSQVTEALCARWRPGVRLLPMSDDPIETHVVIDDPDAETADAAADDDGTADDGATDRVPARKAVHFQEWWIRLHAAVPARQILAAGIESAKPAPGVLEAIADADVILLPPSNPVVSIGTVLAVPGVRDAVRATTAPVVGVSPIIGGAPVRGMADACLSAIGLETSAAAVADLYRDFLGGWLVAPDDADSPVPEGVRRRAVPLLMSDVEAAAAIAGAALDLALELRR
jgi:LPPG:FO 2-phospho-L-lactate transferase